MKTGRRQRRKRAGGRRAGGRRAGREGGGAEAEKKGRRGGRGRVWAAGGLLAGRSAFFFPPLLRVRWELPLVDKHSPILILMVDQGSIMYSAASFCIQALRLNAIMEGDQLHR